MENLSQQKKVKREKAQIYFIHNRSINTRNWLICQKKYLSPIKRVRISGQNGYPAIASC